MSAGPTGSHSRRGSSSSRRSVDSVEKLELQDYGSPSLGQAPHRQHELPGTLFSLPRPALTCAALYLTFGCICDGIQFNSQLTSQTFTSPLLSTTLALTTTAITAFVGPKLVQKVPSWQGSSTEWLGTGALPSPKRWSAGLGLLLAFAQLGWATGASVLPFHILESLPILLSICVLFLSTFFSLPTPASSISFSIIAMTVIFGFAIQNARVHSTGLHAATFSLLSQAAFLCLTRLNLSNHSPAAVLSGSTPVAALSALAVTLLYGWQHTRSAFARFEPGHSTGLPFLAIFGTVQNIALVNLLNYVDMVHTVALLFLPRALLAIFISKGFWTGDISAWYLALCFALCLSIFAYVVKSNNGSVGGNNSPEVLFDEQSEKPLGQSSSTSHYKHLRIACLVALLPFMLWFLGAAPPSEGSVARLGSDGSIDVVFAYYNEPLEGILDQMSYLRSVKEVSQANPKFITYVKSSNVSLEEYKAATGMDEVYRLPNFGREGDTYLHHILRNYNATISSSGSSTRDAVGGYVEPRGLAAHTFFLQTHMSWHWISKPRVPLLRPNTGYLALGPYITMHCGKDGAGNGDFWRQRDIYMMFEEKFCPADQPQLANYAGQFIVSRKRIMNRGYNKYKYLREMLDAPLGHWIHDDATWWHYNGDQSATNPFLGHALERSWAEIMGCLDGGIADRCKDDVFDAELCQCFDDVDLP